jgi:copper chaperone CopZ
MRIAALAAVCLSALLAACDGGSGASKLSEPVTFKLSVKGMHCEGCESAICDKVGKIAGVTACKASHEAAEVEVIAPAEQKDAVAAAIRKLGYTLEG